MSLIIHGRIKLNGLIIQGYEVLHSRWGNLAVRAVNDLFRAFHFLHPWSEANALILLYGFDQLFNLMLLSHHSFGSHILFLELLLLFILFIDVKSLFFEMLQYQTYAIACVVWKENAQNPRLLVIDFPPTNCEEIGIV